MITFDEFEDNFNDLRKDKKSYLDKLIKDNLRGKHIKDFIDLHFTRKYITLDRLTEIF